MSPDDPSDDELLGALDQFTNAVYWLRARTDYTAAQALTEALDDWTAAIDGRLPDEHERDGDLGANLVAFARAQSTNTTLAAALANWTSTISAEHHRSTPFQAPAPPAASGSSTRP